MWKESRTTADFRESTSRDDRRFLKDWCVKKYSNGELIHHDWIDSKECLPLCGSPRNFLAVV